MHGSLIVLIRCTSLILLAAPLAAQHPNALVSLAVAEERREAALDRPALLSIRNVPLAEALNRLSESSGVPVAFSPSDIAEEKIRVSCDCSTLLVRQALDRLLASVPFVYSEARSQVIVFPRPVEPMRTPVGSDIVRLAGLPPVEARARPMIGTVTGRVVDAITQEPLPAVQVAVLGGSIGRLTGSDGRFVLSNVPDGAHTIEARRLGYAPGRSEVTMAPGATVESNFALMASAVALDAVVATGTAGGSRRREVGNAVASVDASAITEIAPVVTMSQLIGGREPGVNILPGSGNIGTGSVLKVRGNASVSLRNQPLVYVDGVRIDNDSQKGPNIRQGRQVSALDDINPADIERVEIIKGPAAATLYGTEASGGVIQIFTKRGTTGAPRFDMTVSQGGTWLMDLDTKIPNNFAVNPTTKELYEIDLMEVERAAGREAFQTGRLQTYNLSMRGGSDQIRYYAAAEWEDNEGIVSYNWQNGINLRGNMSVLPSDKVSVDLSTGYVTGNTRFAQAFTGYDIWAQYIFGNPNGLTAATRGFLRATPESLEDLESTRETSRFIGGLTLRHDPISWFSQRLVLGLDRSDETNTILFPRNPAGAAYFFGSQSLGEKTVERPHVGYTTMDYGATASYALSDALGFKTSAGAQFYHKRTEVVTAVGRNFPTAAITAIAGAAVSTSSESFVENKSFGVFLQQEVALRDRIFLTAAVRADDNSAFGADYNVAIYPKLSAAWVLSEEPFFNVPMVSSLRLRGAWGQAGRQPDAFAALRLYQPGTGPNNAPVVTPSEIGNADLGPEVGEELELGFEASLFSDRLTLDVTRYDQKTRDAIIARPASPSLGFPGSQFVNLGTLSNSGWEIGANAQLTQRQGFGWDLGIGLAHTENKVEDLGGIPPTTSIREGYPFPSIFYRKVLSADLDANGRSINMLCDGGTGDSGMEMGGVPVACATAPEVYWGRGLPSWEMNLNSTFTIMNNLQLYALAELHTGHVMNQTDIMYRHYLFCVSRACNAADDPIVQAYRTLGETAPLGLMDAGFAKLREVSLSYTLPSNLTQRVGASRASVTVAGRNLVTFWSQTKEVFGDPVADPEMRVPASDLGFSSATIIPPLSTFMLTMRLSF